MNSSHREVSDFGAYQQRKQQQSVEGGGGGPYDGDMKERVEKLENAFHEMHADISVIKATIATKADLAGTESTLIKWFLGTAIAMAGLAFAAAKLIH